MLAMHAALALVMLGANPAIQEPTVSTASEANRAHASSIWGPLADLAGYEWDMRRRYIWLEPGRRLAWQQKPTIGDWRNLAIYALEGNRLTVDYTGYGITGVVRVENPNRVTMTFSEFCTICMMSIEKQDEGFLIATALSSSLITRNPAGWAATEAELAAANTALAALEASRGPATTALAATRAAPSAPIVLSRQSSQPRTVSAAPVQPARSASQGGDGTSGPIILAAAPPPPAPMRATPPAAAGVRTNAPSAPTTREALMQAQVTARRQQAAIEAEAERLRQAQAAEAARIAEANRRAAEQSRSSGWGEAFAFVGAIAGGVAAGVGSGGDMTAITAGMAAGSAIVAPNSEIAAASNSNFQVERQRYEEERAFEQRVIAELNNPDNPLTQEARRRDADREASNRAEAERIETEDRQRREATDREALLAQRTAEVEQNRQQSAAQEEREAAQEAERAQQQRREAERREREAEQAREAEERREQAQREAEARRQEQERQRAAAEAERTRVIDFREAVVLCSLTGPQAQFNNWTCQGPLQMNYINFERGDVTSAMRLVDCANARELPRAGSYRAFGCGYGIHPTSPGALRNVPEMLGVFVDGRATFRCPRNISGVCRTQ